MIYILNTISASMRAFTNEVSREQQLTKAIMRRVRLIYYMRLATSPLALQGVMFAVLLAAFKLSISIDHIIDNMSHLSNKSEDFGYVLNAAWHTRFSVQVILFVSCILGLIMAREIVRNIRSYKQSRSAMSGFAS